MPATLVDNRKLWENTTLDFNEVYQPTKYDTIRSQLSGEIKRQFGLTLDLFFDFCVEEYQDIKEARKTLIEMYRNNRYHEVPPPKRYQFINIKTDEVVVIPENRLETDCKTKLNLSSTSVFNLINNPARKIRSWKYAGCL